MKRLVHYLKRRLKRIAPSSEMANSLRYLGPRVITEKKELEKITPYLELIQGCVEDENIKNIAVTGTYGSGKSTVLKTFQNWYEPFKSKKDNTYLNISLASFDAENSDDNKDDKKGLEFEKRVEFSILQQMIYQVRPEILPSSRFRRLINIKAWQLYSYIAITILCLISFLILINYKLLRIGCIKELIDNPDNPWNLIPLGVLIIGIGLIIRKSIFLFNNSRIHKINIKGEMELGDMGESIFNQYLEEILYFFERTSYEVVIIEDIDRFGDTQLFTKLREVNVLLNNSKVIKRPIKFIYAVKDELFKDRTERTKFFDFIVPIIPFVNPHNASEQLLKLVKENNIELSEDFINDITSFIGDVDMRLILNVVNEFNLYRKKISAINLDRLMAMVFYKNLYPKDFASLHQDQGELFKLISKKEEYRKILEEEIEGQKAKIDKRIEKINDEETKNVYELRKIYLFHLLVEIPDLVEFDMGFKNVEDAILDENFEKIRTDKKIKYKNYYSGAYSLRQVNVDNIFNAIENKISTNTYTEREKSIKSKADGELEKLKQERLKLSNEQSRISLLSFLELYKKIGKSEDFEDFVEDLRNPGEIRLIEYLITQGYIGDDYRDYISLFFDISINREDYDFIQKIKSRRSSPFEFQPSDSKKVIDKIPERYFSQRQTLNFDLLSYCLKNKQTERQKLKLYLETLSSNEDDNLEFIFGFAKQKAKEIKPLIQEICTVKTNLWQQLQEANLPEEELRKWVVYIFDSARVVDDILKFENLEGLAEYLSEQNVFSLSRSLSDDRNIKEFLLKKNVKIIELDQPLENQVDLFHIIYKNNLFILNTHNIKRLVRYLKPEINIEDLDLSNYTLLRKYGLEPLLKIVTDDIINYINNILLSEDNKKETEETILEILNNENVERETKERFLIHQESNITDLSNVLDVEDKKLVLKHNKIIPKWLNIFDYYLSVEKEIDQDIIDFINVERNYTELSKLMMQNLHEEEKKTDAFIADLIRSNEIGNEAYTILLNSLPNSYKFFGLEPIHRDKVEILIEKGVLLFTKNNFDDIESSHPNLILFFIENYQDSSDFVNHLMEYEINDNIIIDILKSDQIYKHHKVMIVNSIEETRIISNSYLAQGVLEWWPSNVMLEIEYDGLVAIFEVKGNPDKKTRILLKSFEGLNKEQIKALTELIGEEYEKLFIPHQKPKFEKSSDNLKLISRLDKLHLISSYKAGKSSIKAYPFNKDN